ncbi:hypothetical protein K438DRAFT_1989585 [Mycena galopus ATCC 62051]|nr:hypothetical protein K438DRAFT_1989585 [Mycena galopus ATCC 62051]
MASTLTMFRNFLYAALLATLALTQGVLATPQLTGVSCTTSADCRRHLSSQ